MTKSEAARAVVGVDQTREYLGPGTGTYGNCWAACVATILGLSVDAVPQFGHPEDGENASWFREFQEWLAARGRMALNVDARVEPGEAFPITAYGACGSALGIVGGRSPRGEWDHATVWEFTPDGGARMLHDPHKSREGLATITDVTFLLPYASAPESDDYARGWEDAVERNRLRAARMASHARATGKPEQAALHQAVVDALIVVEDEARALRPAAREGE